MKDFSKINSNQFAIMRASSTTGSVLDDNLALAISNTQEVYTVFDSKEEAMLVANKLIEEHINIEVVVYDYQQKIVAFLPSK